MSWTYDDDLNEAIFKWRDLEPGRRRDELARQLLNRYCAIREEGCGDSAMPDAYPESAMTRYEPIPKDLR